MPSTESFRMERRDGKWRRLWKRSKRPLSLVFLAFVAWLLVRQARMIEWHEVGRALLAYPAATLGLAAALTALSHCCYCCFDLVGRAYAGHRLATRHSMAVAFVSYVVNLNVGTLIGGVGFRFRLYSRLGLDGATIMRVIGASIATNWLGYVGLVGGLLVTRTLELPNDWTVGTTTLQALGGVFIAAVGGYLCLCLATEQRHWVVHGHQVDLPSGGIAVTQWLLSSVNWMLMAAIIYTLLEQRVPYPTVLGVLLLSAIMGVMAHIPAGLGVLEAVFITLLGDVVPRHELLAALLAYRALYYLAPLLLAGLVYARLESRAKARPMNAKSKDVASPPARADCRGADASVRPVV